jgi:hypothetical protein
MVQGRGRRHIRPNGFDSKCHGNYMTTGTAMTRNKTRPSVRLPKIIFWMPRKISNDDVYYRVIKTCNWLQKVTLNTIISREKAHNNALKT